MATKLDEKVEVRFPPDLGGGTSFVRRSFLSDALDAGAVIVDPTQAEILRTEQEQAKFGEGLGNVGKAFALGAGRGFTLPQISDKIAEHGLGMSKAEINALKEENPVASTLGEILGFGGGFLIPAGAVSKLGLTGAAALAKVGVSAARAKQIGQGARLLTAPGLVAATGKAANRATTKALGAALKKETAEKGARFAAPVAAAMAEGAVLGAANLVNEAGLGNLELSAENILTHVGTGAIIDGVLSGIAPVAKGVVVGAGKRAVRAAIPERHTLEGKTLSDFVQNWVNDESLRAIGGQRAVTKFRKQKRKQEAFDFINKWDAKGDLRKVKTNIEKGLEASTKEVNDLTDAIDRLHAADLVRWERDGITMFPTAEEVGAAMRKAVIDNLDEGAVKNKVKELLKQASDLGGRPLTIRQAQDFRRRIDKKITSFTSQAEANLAKIAMRTAVNDVTDKKAADIIRKFGADIGEIRGKDLRDLRRERGIGIELLNFFNTKVDTPSGGRQGLEKLSEVAGNVVGLSTGAFTGSIGAGAISGVLARKIASKAQQEAPFLMMSMADKAASLGAMAKAAKSTENRIGKAIDGFVDSKQFARGAVTKGLLPFFKSDGKSVSEVAAEQSDRMRALVEDPELLINNLPSQISGVMSSAPTVGLNISSTVQRAIENIGQNLPVRHTMPGGMLTGKRPFRPSEGEAASFLRRLRAIVAPMTIIEDLEDGTVSREASDVLRTVYPQIHSKIREEIIERAMDRDEPLPYNKRVALSMIFGIPLDPAIANITQVQSTFETPKPEDKEPTKERRSRKGSGFRPSRANKLRIGSASETQAQRIEAK